MPNPGIEIHEIKPGGKSTIETLIKRMSDMSRRSDDMSEAWQSIAEYARKEFTYEFSTANPAGWSAISAKYAAWKTRNGYPATIGIMTGALKRAMTSSAVIQAEPRRMVYVMSDNETGRGGKMTGYYGKYFNAKRPIVDYVQGRIRARAKEAVKEIVKQGYDK